MKSRPLCVRFERSTASWSSLLLRWGFATVVAICVNGSLSGQQRNTAGLYGRVADQQDASIVGASITLLSVDTGMVRTAQSNETGEFQFPTLPAGDYTVTVTKQGFEKVEQTGIVLQVNDNRRVDVRLPIGAVSTTVDVKAAPATVDTSSATLKTTVDRERVVDLPLNGRDLADLTFLVPGVQSAAGPTGGTGDGAKTPFQARLFSVNGSRQNTLGFTLDGGDNMDTLQNTGMPFPFPDAVMEFSVETSNANSEFGKNSAGSVNIVTKSGTNAYHGDVFWFVRNTVLNANNFFSHSPDQLKRNQGGFTIGGPVLKDKLFFFGGYQQTWIRQLSGSGSALSMPDNHRNGDFSDLLSGKNRIVLTDPTTGKPYPNNQIPTSEFSPAAQNLLKYAPVPGAGGLVFYAVPSQQNSQEWIARTDYRINDKNSIYLRLYQNDTTTPAQMQPNNIFSSTQGTAATAQNGTVAETYTPSSNLVIDTHFTANRYEGNRTNLFPTTIRALGVNISPMSNEIAVSLDGSSDINLSTPRPATFARANFELTHSWQWIKGRHSLAWGTQIEDSRYNEYNDFLGSGTFSFNGQWTGYDQADFLIGYLSNFQQGNGEIEFKRYHYFGFFAGDTFRFNPRLTFYYGARYEPYFPMTDLNNRIIAFDQGAYASGYKSQVYVNAPPGLLFPGDKAQNGSGISRGGTPNRLLELTPRLGFAWDPFGNGRSSLRAGYGVYYDTPEMYQLNNVNDQAPFSFTVQYQNGLFDDPYAGRQQDNVFPFAGDFSKNSVFPSPDPAYALAPPIPRSYTQNWNLTVEHQMGQDWTLRASYVGTKATDLWADYDANAPIYNHSLSLSANRQTIQGRRPRQAYQGLDLLFAGLNQSYNSLQLSANKRLVGGLSNLLSYTWSKNLDYLSSNAQVSSNTVWDPFNFFVFRGPSDYDHRQRFVDSFIWQIPDAGHALHSSVLSAVARNWQAAGIVTLQSGAPFSILSTNDPMAGDGNDPAQVTGRVQLSTSRSRGAQIAQYFNTTALANATPGTYGDLGRNILVGPGYANVDFSAQRSLRLGFLGEAGQFTFRAEAFNVFNRVNLGNPNTKLGSAAFGQITATSAPPRILQFSLKVIF